MFFAVVASQKWEIRSTDIKSAFLQGKVLDRDVYLKPPKEAGLSKGQLWKLKHCLYGLNDAARQFYKSVEECLLDAGCVFLPVNSTTSISSQSICVRANVCFCQ